MKISRLASTGLVSLVAASLALAGCTTRNEPAPTTDGGTATGTAPAPTDRVQVAFVPKLQGVPFFETFNSGGERFAQDHPEVEWLYQGPTTADAAQQADVVRGFINQGVDVIMVAPNDPNSMAPILQEAQGAGIGVGTADTDAPNSVREVFVNQATAEGIGHAVVDTLAGAMGEEGEWAIVSCGETAENLNSWIAAQREYAASQYPNLSLVEVGFSGEDPAANQEQALDFINRFPNLKGLVGQCTTSAVGVAEAVRVADKIGQVFTVGVGTPNSMAPYLEDGSSSGSILWDVDELGYLTAWAGAQLATGTPFQATNNVSPTLPAVEYVEAEKMLVLGDPVVFTTENVGDYDF